MGVPRTTIELFGSKEIDVCRVGRSERGWTITASDRPRNWGSATRTRQRIRVRGASSLRWRRPFRKLTTSAGLIASIFNTVLLSWAMTSAFEVWPAARPAFISSTRRIELVTSSLRPGNFCSSPRATRLMEGFGKMRRAPSQMRETRKRIEIRE